MRRNLFFGSFFVAVSAIIISWLLTGESSPFAEYFLQNPSLPNFWGLINFPSYIAGSLAGNNLHSVNELVVWAVFFIQWFLIGLFFILVCNFIFLKKQS